MKASSGSLVMLFMLISLGKNKYRFINNQERIFTLYEKDKKKKASPDSMVTEKKPVLVSHSNICFMEFAC